MKIESMTDDPVVSFIVSWAKGAGIVLGSMVGMIIIWVSTLLAHDFDLLSLPNTPLTLMAVMLGGFVVSFVGISAIVYGR